MITTLHRSLLEPHPDNPRKDLGDLSELAASISRSGLLQNLTVVPHPDKPGMYRILIGHRRFAASAIAGIDELPCAIEEMSMADQVATMLAENMQRNDLSIRDQVSGVQMMLDLGESVKAIADKTGMSETSVRKRVTIASLPKKEMHLAADKGATLFDLLEVTKLESAEAQAKVLENFGTNNFQWAMRNALGDERKEKLKAKVMPQIMRMYPKAHELTDADTYNGRWDEIWRASYNDAEIKPIPAAEAGEKYGYKNIGWMITLYKENKKWIADKSKEKSYNAWMKDRKKQAEMLNREAFELRSSFIRSYHPSTKADMFILYEVITAEAMRWKALTKGVGYYHGWDAQTMREILAIPYEKDRDKEETFQHELERRNVHIGAALLAMAVCGMATSVVRPEQGYISTYSAAWTPNDDLDDQYRLLTALGYQMSDFEKSLQDNSHEFFKEEHP